MNKHWRNPPAATALDAAFEPFAKAFDFDGTGARFFQDIEELKGDPTPVGALLIDAPAEHFVKPGYIRVLSRRGAAIVLATLQTAAPEGGRGHRTGLRGGGPLTTLVVPGTAAGKPSSLWHTLWANVPENFGATPAESASVFPWQGPTRVSDKASKTPITTPLDVHKGQAFFGLPRRIRLTFEANRERLPCDLTGHVDDVIVREFVRRPSGTNYIGWGKDHPLSPSYKTPTAVEFLPMHLKTSRVGYRQWLGFVFKPDSNASEGSNARLPARTITTFYQNRAGAGFIGELGFGSGVFYLYACIDRDLLEKNLGGNIALADTAIAAFIEGLTTASPTGKQASFARRARASYLRIEKGPQQPRNLAAAFFKPVTGDDLLKRSIALIEHEKHGIAKQMNDAYGDCYDKAKSMQFIPGDGDNHGSLPDLIAFALEA